jgi:hypothetical protein
MNGIYAVIKANGLASWEMDGGTEFISHIQFIGINSLEANNAPLELNAIISVQNTKKYILP